MGDCRGYFRQEKNKSLVSNSNQQDVKAFTLKMPDLLTYFFSKFIFLQRNLKKRLFLAIHGSFLQVLQVICNN